MINYLGFVEDAKQFFFVTCFALVCVSRYGGNRNKLQSKAFTLSRFVRGHCSFSLMFYDLALVFFLSKLKEKNALHKIILQSAAIFYLSTSYSNYEYNHQ